MTANDVRADIEKLVLALLDHSLALDSNRIVRKGNGRQEWVTWASFEGAGLPLYSTATVDEYVRLLRERQYTVLLADYSLLQLSFEFERGVPAGHRLCFYPCPIIFDEDDAREFGIIDYIEALGSEELANRTRLDGPVRLDFDRTAGRPGHPAAHLTICRDSCRIPVFGPLSVGHFVRFIFANFYHDWWASHEFMKGWPMVWLPRTVTEEERLELHIECRQPLVRRLLKILQSSER